MTHGNSSVHSPRRFSTGVRSLLGACSLLLAFGAFAQGAADSETAVLRVCSDPNNLPLSHSNGEGYENLIAAELARDLGRKLEYTYFPQRMGFVRNTLRKQDPNTREFACDLIVGVPAGYEMTATTKPYMRSTYALVFPVAKGLEKLQSPEDLLKLPEKQLHDLRIGVFVQSPGADWLLRNKLLQQVVPYAQQSGDPNENPNSIIERELTAGNIDAAIVWGPIAGHLVRKHSGEPAWRAVPFVSDDQIKFDFSIAMGVRHGEKEWKAALDEWLASHRDRIDQILIGFGIPLLDESGKLASGFQAPEVAKAGSAPERGRAELISQKIDSP
jgi:quinoprotein dehydrogenase-associated probable ABC transporter substrate-binding protein